MSISSITSALAFLSEPSWYAATSVSLPLAPPITYLRPLPIRTGQRIRRAVNDRVERVFTHCADSESKAIESYSHDQELSRSRYRNRPESRQNPRRGNP